MRKTFIVALLLASGVASGSALAFDMTQSGSSSSGGSAPSAAPPSAGLNLDAGQRFADPTEKLLSAPLAGPQAQFGDARGDRNSLHFGDRNGGVTFQALPSQPAAGPNRYFSMENNPWR